LAYHLNLPVSNALVRTNESGRESSLSRNEYYIPGSLLQADIKTGVPATWGMPSVADIYFDQSPVFALGENAEAMGIKSLAWFSTDKPLRSGWALGQEFLEGGVVALEAPVGKGRLVVFGPNIAFRSQPHGLFKLLFNQLYMSEGTKK
ncbi:MAG: peptidase, partial [Bacteroidales bacterium]|nr:peptidase [Bacteroidales bacterium]